MSDVLAIVPARSGSKGIPNKNFAFLDGVSPVERTIHTLVRAGVREFVVSTDVQWAPTLWAKQCPLDVAASLDTVVRRWQTRPHALAQDDTPMLAVVQHVLEQIPGPPDQKIVLLQPTQVLRTPAHVRQALELLTPDVDSVVSVVELPPTHAALNQAVLAGNGELIQTWATFTPARRQDCGRAFIRDGTAYCFWRRTVERHGNIYGARVKPLIIPPEETCPLDTPEDWANAERRLRDRSA